MSEYDSKPTVNVSQAPGGGTGGGLYFIVGGLIVAVVAVGYFLIGMPGLHGNVARAPDTKVDVTVQQPAQQPAAPAAPAAPATPAAPRR
jgi:hypothetical protein